MSLRNTQNWLKENKINVTVEVNEESGEWEVVVFQIDRITNEPTILKQVINVKHHPYGKDCIYVLVFPWDYEKKKRITTTLQRLVYLYFKGDIPENFDIDHIDGDSLNNLPSNLQAISRKDNLKKRELSHKEIAKKYRNIEKSLKFSNNLLYNIIEEEKSQKNKL